VDWGLVVREKIFVQLCGRRINIGAHAVEVNVRVFVVSNVIGIHRWMGIVTDG
jgi:hypothetical protein